MKPWEITKTRESIGLFKDYCEELQGIIVDHDEKGNGRLVLGYTDELYVIKAHIKELEAMIAGSEEL